jgi:hypothetical protein
MAGMMRCVKIYQKCKDNLVIMKIAMLVKNFADLGIDLEKKALQFF